MGNVINTIINCLSEPVHWADRAGMAQDAIADAISREGREIVIVSRHAGAVAWLAQQGITGPVIAQAAADDVRGKVVVGNLPLHLVAEAHQVGWIDMPYLSPADRGRDLTPAEMEAAGAAVRWYIVEAI